MRPRAAAVILLTLGGAALAAPERWTDPAPKLPMTVEGTPHLEFEAEFIVGSGGGFALAYDPTGTWLASGGSHGDIVLYDAKSMDVAWRWRPYGNAVESLSFSPDGKILVSGALDAGVDVWDIAERARIATFTGGTATAFAPDGAWFVYEQGEEIVFVDAKTRVEMRRFKAASIERLAVSRDGRRIAVGAGDGHVRTFDLDGKLLTDVVLHHGEPIYGLGFLADGSVAAAARSGEVRIGSVETSVPKSVGSLAVSPRATRVAVGESSGTVHVFELDGKLVDEGGKKGKAVFSSEPGWVGGLAFLQDGRGVMWLVDGGRLHLGYHDRVVGYPGNESEVKSVAFSRDGRFVAAAGRETVRYEFASRETETSWTRGFVVAGAKASDLLLATEAGTTSFDAPPPDHEDEGGDGDAYGAWTSPDGKRTVISTWLSTKLLGASADAEKALGESGRVFDGAWSADGRSFYGAILHAGMCGNGPREPNVALFVTFDADGKVAGRVPLAVDAQSLDLAPSGKVVALATLKDVELRDPATGAVTETLPVKAEWWRFVAEDAALVGEGDTISLWRRGKDGLVPLVSGVGFGERWISPQRDRLAVVMGGRVFVYRIVR